MRGLSTIATGLVLVAMAVGAFISGGLARFLAKAISAPGVVLLGLGLEVFGALQLAAEERIYQHIWLFVLALVIYGFGLGLASAQLTSLVFADAPVNASGQASVTQSTVRQLGTALGTAMSGAVLSVALTAKLSELSGPATRFADPPKDSAGAVLVGLRHKGGAKRDHGSASDRIRRGSQVVPICLGGSTGAGTGRGCGGARQGVGKGTAQPGSKK